MGFSSDKTIKLFIEGRGDHFHELHVIPHSLKHPDWPEEKTICLANIPPYITYDNLWRSFLKFGSVVGVAIFTDLKDFQAFSKSPDDRRHRGEEFKWKMGYITFQLTGSVAKVFKTKKITSEDVSVGVRKWISDYKAHYPSAGSLQNEITSFMEKFDREEKKAEREAKNQSEDDDGWTTVTRKSTKDAFRLTEKGLKSIEEKQDVRKQKKELKNFYRFQVTESKRQRIQEMRKKFQEDKEKVEKMKTSRRFKPF